MADATPPAAPAAAAPAAPAAAAPAPAAAHKPDILGVGKTAMAEVQQGDYKGAATAVGGLLGEISKTEEGKAALGTISADVQKGDYQGAAKAAMGLFK